MKVRKHENGYKKLFTTEALKTAETLKKTLI